jgi:hypothetical protein
MRAAGSIVPVPAGMMRNKWFPYHVARYLSFEERKAIKRGEVEVLRDHSFEIAAQKTGGGQQQGATKAALDAAWQKYLGGDGATSTTSKRQGDAAAEIISIDVCSLTLCNEYTKLPLMCPSHLERHHSWMSCFLTP